MARASRRWVFTLFVGLLVIADWAPAQVRPDGSTLAASVPVTVRDYSERRFGSPDGLRSLAVYAVETLRDGSLWIGTEAGPHRFDGSRFELVPIPTAPAHVRGIAQTADGAIWFATRVGAVRMQPDGAMRVFGAQEGLPTGTVYSLLVSDAIDGQSRLIASTGGGLAVLEGERWRTIALPLGVPSVGLVARARARDGAPDELWVASSSGGVARWRDGSWTNVYGEAEGVLARTVEHLMVTDDVSRRLFAATSDGVFAFTDDASGGRWQHLDGSPAFAYRLALVPRGGGEEELWVGTLDGLLLRRRGAVWDSVVLRSTEPRTPIHALAGVPGHAGGFAVYVGTFGDGVVRLSVGRGATLVSAQSGLRFTINALLEEPLGKPGVVWVATSNFGVVELDGRTARSVVSARDIEDGRATALHVSQRPNGTRDVWVGAALGAWRLEEGRWVARREGLGRTQVVEFGRERDGDSTSTLLVSTMDGLFGWNGERWNRVAGSRPEMVLGFLGASPNDSTLIATGSFGVKTRRGDVWTHDATPAEAGVRLPQRAVCRLPEAERGRLIVAGSRGVYVRERDEPTWRALPQRLRGFFRSENVYRMRCDDPANVLLATTDGVVVLDLRGRDTASWTVVTVFGPADGLPSPFMTAIGEGGRSVSARWIGTAHGVGRIDLRRLPAPDPTLFTMSLHSGADSNRVSEAARVPYDANRIAISLSLPVYHREEDFRYRIVLDGPFKTAPERWSASNVASYPALPAGKYTVTAWARDYAGRDYGPITRTFTIDYPPWRSPGALLGYAALALGLLVSADRWRLRTLRARADELAASELRARTSEAQFRALFDRAYDANLLVRNGRVIAANAAACALLGEDQESVIGTAIADLNLSAGLTATGPAVDSMDMELRPHNGERIPVSVTVTEITRDDGAVQQWVLRDLSAARAAESERRMLESQVREAQKLESLGTLAGGVAHDFNNLLGVIRGNAELARDAIDDRDEVADHLAAVLDASERARDLVRQILTFSRRATPHERVVDLGEVVRALVPMLRSLIPRTVDLSVVGGDGVYAIRGDVTQLQQLLFNLCSNAEYAMRPTNGGTLEIRLDVLPAPDDLRVETGRVVRLRVRDTGVGMPPEVRDRVFEPFYTTKPTGEGTGLGLSVLHGIVASHGGRVRVQSALGAGTTFEVDLPLIAQSVQAITSLDMRNTPIGMPAVTVNASNSPSAAAGSSPSALTGGDAADMLTGARIMLVDDEPAVARVVERLLKRLGCVVQVFSDPREALESFSAAPQATDLLLTDQTMPGMSGDVLTEAVHKVRANLPVVIVTGYSYRLTPERLAEIGASAVLQKPVPLAQMAATVSAALRGGPFEVGAPGS
jgi:PAS domain S-box-containing protein